MDETNKTESAAKILSVNAHGMTVCAAAARISTTNGLANTLFEKSINNDNNTRLIKNVLGSGHQSIMEHCFFNIAFNNVSAFVEQYIIEFRLASFTVQSRRYVDFSKVGFFKSSKLSNRITHCYDEHMHSLFNTYEKLIGMGIPKEDARFVLPYCFHSNFYCSCNARELLHIICTMCYGRGSVFEEIYTLGLSLSKQFEVYFPGEIERHSLEYSVERNKSKEWLSNLSIAKIELPHKCSADVQIISNSTLKSTEIFEYIGYNFTGLQMSDSQTTDNVNVLFNTRSRELELLSFSFKINNISLSAITHLVRHRMQSILVPCVGNAIYSNKYILPESVSKLEAARRIYKSAFEENTKIFADLLDRGMDSSNCVYFALSGNTMDVISTMNGREFAHYIKLRTCNRAQWEIRNISEGMLNLSRKIYPDIFSKLGPSCFIDGVCPEGSKSCGCAKEVKEHFTNL